MSAKPTKEAICAAVIEYIKEELIYDEPDLEVEPDTGLIESGIMDSLAVFKVIGFLEDRYDIDVEPSEVVIENFASVEAIADFTLTKV